MTKENDGLDEVKQGSFLRWHTCFIPSLEGGLFSLGSIQRPCHPGDQTSMACLGQSNSICRSKPERVLELYLWAHSLLWERFKSLSLFLLNGAGIKALSRGKEKN